MATLLPPADYLDSYARAMCALERRRVLMIVASLTGHDFAALRDAIDRYDKGQDGKEAENGAA